MKLGVFDPIFAAIPLEPMLDRVVELGLEAVEVGAGGWPGTAHCDPQVLLGDSGAQARFTAAFAHRGLAISALSCHGNPIHPDPAIAARDDAAYRAAVRLAGDLGIGRVNLFSGCPGDGPGSRTPNWVTTTWPPEFEELLERQWNETVIPYWREAGAFADTHGVRLGIEMHPGYVVYNPPTLLRLRDAVGPVIGANFDPSHLFWQGIDPIGAVGRLGPAIVHVHAKDTVLDAANVAANGVLDLPPRTDHGARPWVFRAVGVGHPVTFWTDLVVALRGVGYDHVLSIEHEDPFASPDDGLATAISTLRAALDAADETTSAVT